LIRRPLALALLLAPWLALPSCVAALELDGFEDAVVALCKCDSVVPQLGGRCVEVLAARLDSASPGTREAWLDTYAEICHGECAEAFTCYQAAGTCSNVSCSEPEECCGFDAETRCVPGPDGARICGSCRHDGAPCQNQDDCCFGGSCNGTTCEGG
jgi:hypothetical protein